MENNQSLSDTVIKNDYCIGCGACSFVNKDYKVEMDKYGMFKASITKKEHIADDLASEVCPFSDASRNEDYLSDRIFPEATHKNPYLGKYISNYVGYVKEGDYRKKGSSGGIGKWILNELLQADLVDYVLQVTSQNTIGELFTYEIYTKTDNILEGSKSAYYPVTLKDSLQFIKENEGRYVVTAVPCFSKAIRSLCLLDADLKERVKFVVGIVCGHLKSTSYGELLGWQLGIDPKGLKGIEFRGKIPGLKANDKGVYGVSESDGVSTTKSSKNLFGGNWGHGFFKYKACDYCDDIVGETSDISIGDAWLKEYIEDHEGNNVIIIRNKAISELIENAISEDRLNLSKVTEDVVVKSQAGGIRHRREGLSFRIFQKKKFNQWVPKKRVKETGDINPSRKRIYRIREEMRDGSHIAFLKAKDNGSWQYFFESMQKYLILLENRPTYMKIIHKIQEIAYDYKKKLIK